MMRPWIETLARAGFAAKAVVYLVVGMLAWRAAAGTGGRITDLRGALVAVLREPFGRLMIATLAAGLGGYALWRFLEAFADANRCGRDFSGLRTRAMYALSGAVYTLLAFDAVRLAAALPTSAGTLPFASVVGRAALSWVGVVAGAVLVFYAAHEIHDAWRGRLSENLDLGAVSRAHGRWILAVSRIGVAARATIFFVAGLLLLGVRGARANPARTDASDSLRVLASLPQGRWALAAAAAGLMAYGIYQLLHARYRRITPP